MTAMHSGYQTYRRLLGYSKPYWLFFVFGILGTVIMSSVDAGFTGMVKPIINHGFVERNKTFIHWLPALIFLAFVVRAVSGFASSYFITRVARTVVRDLRAALFEKLLRLPPAFYDTHSSGYILSGIIYNVEQVAEASSDAMLVCLREVTFLMGLVIVIFLGSWQLGCLFFILGPAIYFVVRWSSLRMRKLSQNVQESMGDVTHVAGQTINGYRVVRLYGGEKGQMQKFMTALQRSLQRELKIVVTNSAGSSLVQFIFFIPIAITLGFATSTLFHVSAGGFVSIITAMFGLLRPVKRIGLVNTSIQKGVAGAEAIFKMLDQPVEADTGVRSLPRVKGDIVFDNVEFAYTSSTGPVLKKISFTVPAGKTVAFVGKSGSGKSTLLNLLPRFYEIQSGAITIDGVNIKEVCLADLRKQFAFVAQDTMLFDDTVANNIAYAVNGDVSDAQLQEAAEAAHAMEFISQLPEGFNTLVGENGVLLSGGQRQRVAIARALLKNAPILMLDEATASLDTHAERHIQKALEELMQNRTTLVIAHRLSTIEKADCILVMSEGEIIERGTHRELLDQNGAYAALYRAQFTEAQTGER